MQEKIDELVALNHPMYRPEGTQAEDEHVHDRMLQAGCESINVAVRMSQ